MPDIFIPLSEVEWIEQIICDRYRVRIPKFLADAHAWWGSWERERFASMEENLRRGDVLFDVGAETGWQSAIYARFVGAENMVLVEPCAELWPHVKAAWEENRLHVPAATCWSFMDDGDIVNAEVLVEEWPVPANAGRLMKNTKFLHLDESPHGAPHGSIDWLIWSSCLQPKALTIDVEGAELRVLRGAESTLRTLRPLVWASLHEGFVSRPGVAPRNADVNAFMDSLGYEAQLLATDHERHVLYRPR